VLGLQAAHHLNRTNTTRHRCHQRGLMVAPTEKISPSGRSVGKRGKLEIPQIKEK
jgi:hypothetical protein